MSARAGVRPLWPVAGASLWMATAANAALWSEMRMHAVLQGAAGWTFGIALALTIAACVTALVSLLAWRWTLKPVLAALLLASAAASHFMLTYHVVIDSDMIVNVMQTDAHEAAALLGWRLAATVALLGVLPAALLWRLPLRHAGWRAQALRNAGMAAASLAVACALVLLNFQPFASTMRNHKQWRYLINPLNTLYAIGHAMHKPQRRSGAPLALGTDATLPPFAGRPPLLVLVLGETARAGNFGLNGYPRATTPELARENIASARRAISCGTSTAASVPCMFSHLGRAGYDNRSQEFETLMDVLQRAGLAVLWLDNQSGCKGVCDRVPYVNTARSAHPRLCPEGECLDEVMLEGLDQRLQALPAERAMRGVVLVLHQMGSHGPAYHLRSLPAYKRFLPECATADLQACDSAEVMNAYDNSIAYTDHFLASTIGWLKRHETGFDTAMLYVADHGESLGENNLYLHGMPYAIAPEVQKHVPWITWLSPGFEQRAGVSLDCLRQSRDTALSHDNYFHSVLGLLRVGTSAYDRRLDAYAACAGHPAKT